MTTNSQLGDRAPKEPLKTRCMDCARREDTIRYHKSALQSLAYKAQSVYAGRATKAKAEIPAAKDALAEARRLYDDHLKTCTADDRHGMVS